MSIERIIARWTLYGNNKNFLDWELGESYVRNKIRTNCFRRGWIPFAYQGGSDYIGIDLEPGSEGIVGQVINFGNLQETKYVLANSIPEFFDWYIQILESGNFRVHQFEPSSTRGIYLQSPPTEDFFWALPSLIGS